MKLTTIRNIVISAIVVFFLVILLFSSMFTVTSGQEVVIQRFGAYQTTITTPGINFKIPFVDKATVVDVNQIYRMEFGFNSIENSDGFDYFEDDFDSSLMLTQDENIAMVETIVQYQIVDPVKYLFEVDDVEGTLRVVAESSIRRGIASYSLDDALTENKSLIQQDIMLDLQEICDKYNSGIRIVGVQLQDVNPPIEVDDAFKDVAGAREDKTSYINEANAYANDVIPTARGEAAAMINSAEAYKAQRVEEAKGDVAAYTQLYAKYLEGVETTRTRLYLEMMQEILPNMQIYVMDDENGMKLFNLNNNA